MSIAEGSVTSNYRVEGKTTVSQPKTHQFMCLCMFIYIYIYTHIDVCVFCFVSQKSGRLFPFSLSLFFAFSNVNFIHLTFIFP